MDYTEADVAALAAKLDGLELSDGERAAFGAALMPIDEDTADEVSGFALNAYAALKLNVGEFVSQRAMFQLQGPSIQQPGAGPVPGIVDCRG